MQYCPMALNQHQHYFQVAANCPFGRNTIHNKVRRFQFVKDFSDALAQGFETKEAHHKCFFVVTCLDLKCLFLCKGTNSINSVNSIPPISVLLVFHTSSPPPKNTATTTTTSLNPSERPLEHNLLECHGVTVTVKPFR